jgi:hypothetical protein
LELELNIGKIAEDGWFFLEVPEALTGIDLNFNRMD